MDRREMFGTLAAGTAGLFALNSGASASASAAFFADDAKMKEVMKDCLKACEMCAVTCEQTFTHCFGLVSEGKKEHAKAAQYALDCADFCALSVKMMLRESDLMSASCGACSEACKKCGDECAKFDSEIMKKCVAACRECEKTCKAMVSAMGSGHHHE